MTPKLARILIAQIDRLAKLEAATGRPPHNCFATPCFCTPFCRINIHSRIVNLYGLPSTDYLYFYAAGVTA
jgi:hypothetical protein